MLKRGIRRRRRRRTDSRRMKAWGSERGEMWDNRVTEDVLQHRKVVKREEKMRD